MSLTENQKTLFEAFSEERQLEITQEFQPKYDSFQQSIQSRLNLIKSHCQARLDAQVDATNEWLGRFNTKASQDDQIWLIQKIPPLAEFGVLRFREYLDSPFALDGLPEDSKNDLEYQLRNELNDYVAIAMRRLRRLFSERKELLRLNKKIDYLFLVNLGVGLIGLLVSIAASAYSVEIRKCLDKLFGK